MSPIAIQVIGVAAGIAGRGPLAGLFAALRGDRHGASSPAHIRSRSVGELMKTGLVTVGEDTTAAHIPLVAVPRQGAVVHGRS